MPEAPFRDRLTVAYSYSTEPMGQQEYESQLISALSSYPIDLRVLAVRGVRSGRGEPGGRRIPLRASSRIPEFAQPALANWLYGRGGLVHRLDAGLPSRGGDVLTIHDVAPLMFPDEGSWPRHATAAARRAAAVIVPSHASARDIKSHLGLLNLHVIPNGVDPACYDTAPLSLEERRQLSLVGPHVVYAGGSSRRKNLAALAEAWRRVGETTGIELLVCGPDSSEKQRLFSGLPRCRVLGRVERGKLLRLMRSSVALVVPSTYEGFGLPVLEAMAVGTLVVAARAPAIPEIAGDAAILVDPTARGLANGIEAAITCDRRTRIAAGRRWAARFTWTESARRHVEVYAAVANDV